MSWKCYTIEAVDPFPELIDPWFEDGTIGWTSPSAEDTVFPAYDIYFADDEGETFAAVARVNVAPDHQGEIEYTLSDIPGEARYAAVVPLAVYTDIEGEEWVYRPIEPFLIELSEAQQPALLEVVETGSMFFGNDFTLYYRIENPNNVNYTELVTLYRHVNGSWVSALNWEFTWLFGGLHVTAGNLAIGSYRLVIEFKVGSDVAAELVRDFDIVDSLRLNQLKVNGIAASRDEHDAYHYIVRVDWDAEEALVTGMSPDGVVRIGESTVGANIPYSVALDGVETDMTLVVRHPTDEELYSEYRLTIIRTKPEITLTYLSFSADFVHLEWESVTLPGKQYSTEFELFGVNGDSIPLNILSMGQNFARIEIPQPGAYMLVVRLVSGGVTQDEDYGRFTIAGPQLVNFYIFGTDQVIGDLNIRTSSNPNINWTSVQGDGFVRYTIEHIQTCFSVGSNTWLITGPSYCSREEGNFVAHATQAEIDTHLNDIKIDTWADGELGGTLWFYWFGDSGVIDDYRLVVVDRNGTVHSNVCMIDKPDKYEFHNGHAFTCSGIPENAKYLRIDILIDQGYVSTNMAVRIDQVELPDTIELLDADPRAGWLDLTVRFGKSADESEIALYKIITPRHAGVGSTYTAIVEANDQEESYEVHFGGMETHPGDRVILQAYDRDGYLILTHTARPVIDVMTAQSGLIEYAGCYAEVLECKPADEYGTYPEPSGAGFEDEDPTAGSRTGDLEWTVPDVSPARVIAYDLYYADGESILLGEARVNRIGDGEQFKFRLTNVPQNAEYVAVVPLLTQNGEYLYADPFYIALDDHVQQEPEPDELVEGSELIRLDDGSYGYVPKGMKAGALIAKFRLVSGTEAMVMDGDDPLDSQVTVSPGSILLLSYGAREEEIRLVFLSELLRPSDSETITVAHVAVFIIAQLAGEAPVDLTGDGKFDREDVRELLGEIED